MNVAFVKCCGLAPGGTEKDLQSIATVLAKNGHNVDYFYTNPMKQIGSGFVLPDNSQKRKEFVESFGIKTIPVFVEHRHGSSFPYEWGNTDFWNIFDETKYDILQIATGGNPEYPFNVMKSIKIIEKVHSTYSNRMERVKRSILISQWQADQWKINGGDISKATIIPNIVYVPEGINEDLRDSLNIPKDAFVYGFHQAERPGMFHSISLDAFNIIQHSNNFFIIMGGDKQYQEYVLSRGIKNVFFVNFSDKVENIHKFLNTLNVFAHARSDGEVCSCSIIEALSHGLPVLSHPGINMGHIEQIGNCGIVTTSVEEYAQEMKRLENNKDYLTEKSSIAFNQYKTKYDYRNIEQRFLDVYAEVLAEL